MSASVQSFQGALGEMKLSRQLCKGDAVLSSRLTGALQPTGQK